MIDMKKIIRELRSKYTDEQIFAAFEPVDYICIGGSPAPGEFHE